MPKQFHAVDWRTRKAQRDFARLAALAHDREQAELYLDDAFLVSERDRMRERLVAIGVLNSENRLSVHP